MVWRECACRRVRALLRLRVAACGKLALAALARSFHNDHDRRDFIAAGAAAGAERLYRVSQGLRAQHRRPQHSAAEGSLLRQRC